MANGPYSRLYHELMDEYPEVFGDNARLGCYARLLMVAEKFYPQHAPVPRKDAAYKSLVSVGLVIEDPSGSTYAIRGLTGERERRSEPGRIGAAVRWHKDRNGTSMPEREETRRDEKEKGAIASNQPPQTFMGFRPKEKPEPGIWAGASTHDGRHGKDCMVCYPSSREKASA